MRRKKKAKNIKKKLLRSISILLIALLLGSSFSVAGIASKASADESVYDNANGFESAATPEESEGGSEELPAEGETPGEEESESEPEESEIPEESEAPGESESEPEESKPHPSIDKTAPEFDASEGLIPERGLPSDDIIIEIESELDAPGEGLTESVVTIEQLAEEESLGGYVISVVVTDIEDGTAPFDEVEAATPAEYKEKGIDTSSSNRIVRTFDTISYAVTATFGARDKEETATSATVCFEMTLPSGVTEARIDMDSMNWFKAANSEWHIDFLDSSGNVVMIQKSDGCYYVEAQDEDGGTQADDASQGGDSDSDADGSDADEADYSKFTVRTYIDALATGSGAGDESETTAYVSDGAESGAYMVAGIVSQRLRGTYELKAEDGTDNVLSSTKGWTAGVKVLNAKNDTTIAPSFRVWFKGNEDNEGPATGDEGEGGNEDSTAALDDDSADGDETAEESQGGDTAANTATADTVTVTSSPRFDLQLTYDTYLMYNSWYDFSTGKEVTDERLLNWLEEMSALPENQGKVDPSTFINSSNTSITVSLTETESANLSNIRYGQMNTLSIALHLANEYLSKKEMRGISFPTGEITFDIELKAEAEGTDSASLLDASDESTTPSYYAVLWDYNENVTGTNKYTYEDDVTESEGESETHTHQRQGMTTAYQGNLGRNLSWDGISESRAGYNVPYAYMGAVNGGKVSAAYAYDSGYLTLTAIGGKSADGAGTNLLDGDDGDDDDAGDILTTSATDANQIYSFSLTDYDIELDNYSFPTQTKGGSGRALGTTQFCIFSGMVQVLNVFPRVQAEAATINYTYTIGNLALTDISGDTISPDTSGDDGDNSTDSGTIDYSYEVCGYGADNKGKPYNEASGSLTLYPPGSSAKGNWFGEKADDITSLDSYSRFSGIEWDAAALLGSDVYIIGRFEVGNSSSSRVGAMNYLQLFDSHGLYTRPNAAASAALEDDTDGNADGDYITASDIRIYSSYGNNPSPPADQSLTLLFAADPDYPSGYDTNNGSTDAADNAKSGTEIQTYMNTVREEDLVYSDKLYKDSEGHYTILKFDTDSDGTMEEYTCIGYLLELRNTDFKSNAYFTFPMTITDDEAMKTKTVMTVNAVRAWAAGTEDAQAMQSLSWANGSWDSTTSKNTLEGYKDITKRSSSGSGGTVTGNGWENNNGDGKSGYKKVEYGAAGYESGNDGGYQYGNTLLILAYTATLSITADGTYFDMDSDAGTVNYTIKDIETKFSQERSGVSTTTDLCIYVDLDPYSSSGSAYPASGNAIADYASIMSGSFAISVGGESITISSDPEKPTTISYTDSDSEKTYTVYVVISEDASSAVLYLSGVSVGDKLPDITFSAALGAEMENNDYVVAGADISGDGYVHAFGSASAMLSDCTIYTTRTSGTRLKKKVNLLQIPQGGTITYTLSYTNQSNGAVDMYLYDILPYNGDARRTDYHGMTYLAGYEATVSGGDSATTTAYYSDDDQNTLTNHIANFGGSGKEGNESTIKGWLPGDEETSKTTKDESGNTLFTFTKLGKDSFSEESKSISATCVYFAINNLPSGATITLKIEMATELNKAYDIYGDYAYCWTTTSGSPLKSNLVQTVVTGSDSDTPTGDIIISTNAFGGDSDDADGGDTAPKEFTFDIELSTPLNGTYGDVTFTDGKATINIKSGESVTIEGLPKGTCYTVTEDTTKTSTYTPNGGATREGSVSGGETDKVHIDNITGDTGSVTVTTTASGSASSSNDEFSFTVTLSEPLNGTYGGVTFKDGVATFNLKSGQSVNISGIPAGVSYTVTETDANGYTVSGGTQTGSVTKGKTTVTIKNVKNAKGSSGSSSGSGGGGGGGSAYSGGGSSGGGPGGGSGGESVSTPTAGDSVPKTGDETHILLYTLMALIGLMGSAYCVRRLRYDE